MRDAPDRLSAAITAIDEANLADPVRLSFRGASHPQALLEGVRAQAWLERLYPASKEPMRLAARAHHLRRWEIPRDSYPRTREGYHAWRTRLYSFHGEALAGIMRTAGYGDDDITRAAEVIAKKRIKADADAQAHEDAVSLAFLEVRLEPFAPTVEDEPLARALRRTWAKMSAPAREAALAMDLPPAAKSAIASALGA